jgi:hypothetical protein
MTRCPTLAGLACVALLGCHGHPEHVDASYFGPKVVPPGPLAKLRPGMTLAEVTAIAPGAHEMPLRGYLVDDSRGAKQYVVIASGIVTETYVALEGDDAKSVLTAAWGAPTPDPDDGDDPVWRSTETGWRARLTCGHGTKRMPVPAACTVTFHPYRPAAELFTKAIQPGGVLGAIKPDATVADALAATHLPFSDHRDFQRTSDFDGGTETVSFGEGRLHAITYFLPASTRDAIDKAWGPPAITSDDYEAWLDPATGWRAVVDRKGRVYVTFSSYWPDAKLLSTLEAIAASPDLAAARRDHAELAWDADGKGVTLPDGGHNGVFGSPNHVSVRQGAHLSASIVLHPRAADRDGMLAEFATRWGTPKTTKERDEVTYHYPTHALVTVDDDLLFVEVQ